MQNKSELSTAYENIDNNLMHFIDKLKQENQYLKKALETAESLIKNYQQENDKMVIQIKILQCKLGQAQRRLIEMQKNVERLDVKRSIQCTLNKKHQKQQSMQVQELSEQIRNFTQTQQKYEKKIQEMEHKIVILELKNQQNELLKKQPINLSVDLQNRVIFSSFQTESDRKVKNLSELKAFHLKLKQRDVLQPDRNYEKDKNVKGIVERVFQKQKSKQSASVRNVNSRNSGTPIRKKKY